MTTAPSVGDLRPRRQFTANGREREAVKHFGRVGFAAKGLLYLTVGLLVGRLALGGSSQEADSKGAFDLLASQPFGQVLLGLTAVGLAAYGLWRLAMVFVGDTDDEDLPGWVHRAAWLRSAVAYGFLAWLAASKVLGGGSQGGGDQQAGTFFDLPGGVALVGIVGLLIVAAGVQQARRAVNGDWADHLDLASMDERQRNLAILAGKVGHVGRAIAFGLVGAFVMEAALTYDPDQPVGLDAALPEVQGAGWGLPVLLAVSVGLAAYGVWCAMVTFKGDPHE